VLHEDSHVHADEEVRQPRVRKHFLIQQLNRRQNRWPSAQALVD